jgi:hypothetical protein
MATYNGARFLREQLDSFVAQTRPPHELVVGDDSSTDDTIAILEDFACTAPFPVRIYRNPKNLGFADNFLQTAERCDGDWIALSDQDDVWYPEKIERITAAIDRHSGNDLVMVVHQLDLVDGKLRPTGQRLPAIRGTHISPRGSQSASWFVGGCAMTVRSDLVREIEWRQRPLDQHAWAHGPGKKLMAAHDLWLSWLANSLGSTLLIAEPLACFRRHEGALTGTHVPSYRALIRSSINRGIEMQRAEVRHAQEIAACLRAIASNVTDHRKDLLHRSAAGFERRALVLGCRAELYEKSGASRISHLLRLVAQRVYFGDPFASLGWRPLLKDLFVSFLGKH